MPNFAKFLGKLTKQVNKLTSADEVHSIAGWIIKDSGVTPNRYSTSFDFFHVGMEEFFTGTQAELVEKTGLSPSLISQMVTETIPHANGWVLAHNKTNIGALKQNVNGNWYSPSRPWNNTGATPASLLTWAMALEIKKVWTVLQITKADIGGISILRSMGLSNQLQHHIVDDLAKGFREKTFEPETDLEWQEFAKSFSAANELPKYNFSGKLIDGRSKGSNRHGSEIRQKIAEAINNDEGTVSIARKLNISRSSVQRFKKKYLSSN